MVWFSPFFFDDLTASRLGASLVRRTFFLCERRTSWDVWTKMHQNALVCENHNVVVLLFFPLVIYVWLWTSQMNNSKQICWFFLKQDKLVGGLEHVLFPYIGNNHPNWLSYFSEGLKSPVRQDIWTSLLTVSYLVFGFSPESICQVKERSAAGKAVKVPYPKRKSCCFRFSSIYVPYIIYIYTVRYL